METLVVNEVMNAAARLVAENGTDILIFSGPIDDENCDLFIDQVMEFKQRKPKVTLFLCTYGGDPHAAYRMARVLGRLYSNIRILVGGYCKSAGTLMALCADSLGFSETGELGPLDTQLSKPDEVMQMASGLEVFSTLQYLTDHAFSCFEQSMLAIIRRSGQSISTRLASEIASKLTTGLLKPITAQLDPNRIGIAQRGLKVTKVYGTQLANKKNLKDDADTVVQHLVNDYPTHAFVIDQKEAETLFKNVSVFDDAESGLYEQLRTPLTRPDRNGFIINLSAMVYEESVHAEASNINGAVAGSDPTDSGDQRAGGASNGKAVAQSGGGTRGTKKQDPAAGNGSEQVAPQ